MQNNLYFTAKLSLALPTKKASIKVHFMNYSCYKEAFSALVQENDGVLPDLYEEINITISCHPADAPALSTVADVVAYAIIETSNEFQAVVEAPRLELVLARPTSASTKLVCLDRLLTQAVTSFN